MFRHIWKLAIGLLAASATPAVAQTPLTGNVSGYANAELSGFRIYVSRGLGTEGSAEALACLERELNDLTTRLPAGCLAVLRDVTVWVEAGDFQDAGAGQRASDVCYWPLDYAGYLRHVGYRHRAGGVQVFAARRLTATSMSWNRANEPGWLVHEFAHALHDRVLGFDDPRVREVYRVAVERGIYDSVALRVPQWVKWFATNRGVAYARTNHLEYFAELSLAYFGLSRRSFPFTRDDLKAYDPWGYAVVDAAWTPAQYLVASDLPGAVKLHRLDAVGRRSRLCDLAPGQIRAFDGWPGQQLVATGLGGDFAFVTPASAGGVWRLTPGTRTAVKKTSGPEELDRLRRAVE